MTSDPVITILIAEDHEIVRIGLKYTLEQIANLRIVGEAADGLATVAMALELKPDLVLMDVGMPELDGIEATRQIKIGAPTVRVLMLTTHDNDDDVFAALAAGADGYCLKNCLGDQLAVAIRAVKQGAAWLDPAIAKTVINATQKPEAQAAAPQDPEQKAKKFNLSPRELEILEILVEGSSNQQIADRLVISPETVKTHMRHIMEKLVVADRTQAAVKALRAGLISSKASGAK